MLSRYWTLNPLILHLRPQADLVEREIKNLLSEGVLSPTDHRSLITEETWRTFFVKLRQGGITACILVMKVIILGLFTKKFAAGSQAFYNILGPKYAKPVSQMVPMWENIPGYKEDWANRIAAIGEVAEFEAAQMEDIGAIFVRNSVNQEERRVLE